MPDQKKQFEKAVRKTLDHLRRVFFLGEYSYAVSFDFDDQDEKHGRALGAENSMDTKYLNFKITVYKCLFDLWKKGNAYDVTETLAHEVAHLLIEPVYLFGVEGITNPEQRHLEEVKERQTQRITNVVMALLPKKEWIACPPTKKKEKPRKSKKKR